ncbi:MAG: hypothetical protein M1834_009297 [Cirrosporium novae-zelandiae]|nr:MAG: hypothetical protein M1834_009297 [Cirrosporium novae-zelandiae]
MPESNYAASEEQVSDFVTRPDAPDPEAYIDPDDANDDADSAFGGSVGSDEYTASLTSSVLDYKYENGRRYHAYHAGEYIIPNDELEQERMDLHHHIHRLVLSGALFRAPIKSDPNRVLDIGTGTGIWAIDFADEFPSAVVIGTDLSPIQPSWVPPNCIFEIDDCESDWPDEWARQPFDFIHARSLAGSIRDHSRLLSQAFDNLAPGGWMEMQDFEVWIHTDDDTIQKAKWIRQWQEQLEEASIKFGKRMNVASEYKGWMIKAGFEDVTDDIYKCPLSPWPRDPKMKELGRTEQVAMLDSVESYTLALFTRVLGWSNAETQVLIAGVRKEILDLSIHIYGKIHFAYGRKPLSAA